MNKKNKKVKHLQFNPDNSLTVVFFNNRKSRYSNVVLESVGAGIPVKKEGNKVTIPVTMSFDFVTKG